jgi:alpha-beta hydrolase superfamily lysophospholipase
MHMKPKLPRLRLKKQTWICFAVLCLIPLTACTTMNVRHHQWEKSVTRNAEGILDFAQPQRYGQGKQALLLVHGFGDSPAVWAALAPELAKQGYHVYAMRLPGWGESIDRKRNISLEDWESAIIENSSLLKEDHEKVAVLAHSLGGCLSTVLAQSDRLPADALVLYAPMLEVSSARSPLLKTRTWFKIGDKILPDSMIIESLFADHARVIQPRPKSERDPFSPKNIFQMIYAEMDRFEAQTPEMQIPLRLVLPGEDRVINSQRALAWFETLHAPTKTLYIDQPAGHVLPLDMDVLAESDRLVIWLTEQGIAP